MTPQETAIYNTIWLQMTDMLGLPKTSDLLGDLLATGGSSGFASPVADLPALRLITSGSYSDRQVRLVESEGALYHFDSLGTGADDASGTIVPADVTPPALGRWFKTTSSPRLLVGSLNWDPPSLAVGEVVNSGNVTVTGATLGDTVLVSAPYSLVGTLVNGTVTATNTIQFDVYNMGVTALDLDAGIWRVTVIRAS